MSDRYGFSLEKACNVVDSIKNLVGELSTEISHLNHYIQIINKRFNQLENSSFSYREENMLLMNKINQLHKLIREMDNGNKKGNELFVVTEGNASNPHIPGQQDPDLNIE